MYLCKLIFLYFIDELQGVCIHRWVALSRTEPTLLASQALFLRIYLRMDAMNEASLCKCVEWTPDPTK